jgi:hypothetical protein
MEEIIGSDLDIGSRHGLRSTPNISPGLCLTRIFQITNGSPSGMSSASRYRAE